MSTMMHRLFTVLSWHAHVYHDIQNLLHEEQVVIMSYKSYVMFFVKSTRAQCDVENLLHDKQNEYHNTQRLCGELLVKHLIKHHEVQNLLNDK